MVTPRSIPSSLSSTAKAVTLTPASSNKHVLAFIKIVFTLIILLLLPQMVESKNKRNKQRRKLNRFYNELRLSCAEQKEEQCRSIKNLAENEMCITKCMNLGCHESIFSDERGGELEPGEVDEVREAEFEDCVKKFIKKEGLMKKSR